MLTTVDRVLFLLRAPATAEATTDSLARLVELAAEVDLDPGARLFTQGQPPDALWILYDGAVRLEGVDVAPRLAGPGELLAGLALLAGAPHPATATALVTSHALRVDRADLLDLLDEDGELGRVLFAGLLRALAAHEPSALAG